MIGSAAEADEGAACWNGKQRLGEAFIGGRVVDGGGNAKAIPRGVKAEGRNFLLLCS